MVSLVVVIAIWIAVVMGRVAVRGTLRYNRVILIVRVVVAHRRVMLLLGVRRRVVVVKFRVRLVVSK